jgi:hypothetical protein
MLSTRRLPMLQLEREAGFSRSDVNRLARSLQTPTRPLTDSLQEEGGFPVRLTGLIRTTSQIADVGCLTTHGFQ